MAVMTVKEILQLLEPKQMNPGRALARLSRSTRQGGFLPPAQREFLQAIYDAPRRSTIGNEIHPEDKAERQKPRRDKDEDLSPVELAWLQRLPLDPAAVTFDDAVQLAALASTISKMKTPASHRLVESVWQPVKDLHDERLAKARLEKARIPLPQLPASTTEAVADALAERHPGVSPEALMVEARPIVSDFEVRRQREHDRGRELAEKRLQELSQDRERRAEIARTVSA